MIFQELQRDLFSMPQGFYLAHCISGDYALFAGIAVRFDREYNMKLKLHKQHAIPDGHKYFNVGRALLVDNVFNLVTKPMCYNKPTYDTLYDTLVDMREQCKDLNITKVAIPFIGCGFDQLKWDKVKEIIFNVFGKTNMSIIACYL